MLYVVKPKSMKTAEGTTVLFGNQANVLDLLDVEVATVYYSLVAYRDRLARDLSTRYDGNVAYSAEDDVFLSDTLLAVTKLMQTIEETGTHLHLAKALGGDGPRRE